MGRVIRYVSQEKKTMDETGRRYLSGVNCTPELAQKSFMATKNLYGKADGIFFYQYVQCQPFTRASLCGRWRPEAS